MTDTNWGALIVFAQKLSQKIAADIATNTPPPSPDGAVDMPTLVSELESALPKWRAEWVAHQGVATGVVDLLTGLASKGVPYADMIRDTILEVPTVEAEIEKWLPTAGWFLSATQPAATGISGDDHHVGRG